MAIPLTPSRLFRCPSVNSATPDYTRRPEPFMLDAPSPRFLQSLPMLDVKFIVEHADLVKRNSAHKNERRAEVDKVLALNEQKKKLQLSVEEARTKINQISKDIAAAKKADPKADVAAKQGESRAIGEAIKKSEEDMKALQKDLEGLLLWIPNVVHESVPVGEDAKAN